MRTVASVAAVYSASRVVFSVLLLPVATVWSCCATRPPLSLSAASAMASAAAAVTTDSVAALLCASPSPPPPLPPLRPALASAASALALPARLVAAAAAAIAALLAVAHAIAATPAARAVALAALTAAGDVPPHIAMIMDGNRRWARASSLDASAGYPRGSDVLLDTLRSCLALGVATVTVYAFSIENFKRPPAEVDRLMHLATQMLTKMLSHASTIQAYSVRVRVLGDRSLLPPAVRVAAARAEVATRSHTGPTLNIAFAYTSRHEMASAVTTLIAAADAGAIPTNAINSAAVEACLFTGLAYGGGVGADGADGDGLGDVVDLLVRTSGERRLSDFLCWQGGGALLAFRDVLWPDFTAWELVRVVLTYQASARLIRRRGPHAAGECAAATAIDREPITPEVVTLVAELRRRHYATINADAAGVAP